MSVDQGPLGRAQQSKRSRADIHCGVLYSESSYMAALPSESRCGNLERLRWWRHEYWETGDCDQDKEHIWLHAARHNMDKYALQSGHLDGGEKPSSTTDDYRVIVPRVSPGGNRPGDQRTPMAAGWVCKR